jgi:glutamyl-tRNA reductase
MLLNTCNRIEFIGAVSNPDAVLPLLRRILRFESLKPDAYYLRRGPEAFEHTAVLAAGLLSQMPGEGHIVGQIKEALDEALRRQWGGSLLREWCDALLHVSKSIRGRTGPLLRNLEIEDLCVEFLESECAALAGKRVVVIGTGTVGCGLIERLLPRSVRLDWLYHSQRPDLPEGAADQVSLGTLNQLRDCLPAADIVISAAASPGHVLHQGHAPFFDQEKPVLLVDLAIPRNIAPELDGLTSNLKVVDMDDLKAWSRRESVDLVRVYELSRDVVKQHAELYERLVNSLQSGNAGQ